MCSGARWWKDCSGLQGAQLGGWDDRELGMVEMHDAGTGSHRLPFSPFSSQAVFPAPLPPHHPPLLWHGP